MYSSIHVKGLRCLQDLALSNLAPVNLIVGQNNVGKTTLLEAIFLYSGRTNPQLALVIEKFRGLELRYSLGGPAPWDMLFHDLDRSQPIVISVVETGGQSKSVELSVLGNGRGTNDVGEHVNDESRGLGLSLVFTEGGKRRDYKLFLHEGKVKSDDIPPPPAPCVFVFARERGGGGADDVERFSALSINRQTGPVVGAMKIIEPRLQDLTVNLHMGSPTIWADIGLSQLLPVRVLGDGLCRVLSLVSAIVRCPRGLVLVDEIDAGLHHSTHRSLWRAIMDLALRLDVQIFATTHSHDCLVAARDAAVEFAAQICGPMFRLHRLDRVGERIEAVTYDAEALDGAIAADLEVR
ncbi:MAG: AAA family ATPase [Phycisphaerae bacterium]|nr:AAA family ATPase [Phycisphaerae bacterium]